MNIEADSRNFLKGGMPDSLGFWLDNQPETILNDRQTLAKLSLVALLIYRTRDSREQGIVIWTLDEANKQLKQYLDNFPNRGFSNLPEAFIPYVTKQVFLDLNDRDLLTRYTLTEEAIGMETFSLRKWRNEGINEYEGFLANIVSTEAMDTHVD